MSGLVTKKHWREVWKAFGLQTTVKLLVSREPVALTTLMS